MKRVLTVLVASVIFAAVGYGQILFTAKLDGSQENPPITTAATGTGTFVLNSAGTSLTYAITVNGLTMTAAHFHNAAAGTNGGVVKNLTFINNTASGVWSSSDASQPLSNSLFSELLRGRLYVNVHTSANPGGEIRGQVLFAAHVGFSAKLEGAQENPPVSTTAGGTASVTLGTNGSVTYDVTVTGLTPTASHFHNAPAGTNGGVVKTITLTNNASSGTWSSGDATQPLTDALLRELVRGRLYANAHTSANPGGEIRGQVRLNTGASFTAKLDGNQENPPVTTSASGTGWFVLNANASQLSYNITVNGLTMTAAHFHNAAAGINGGVVKNLTFTNNTASGVWGSSDASQPLTDSLLSELLRGRLYVNVHTSANPGGEIRGQVLLTSGVGFVARLEGAQENPPVSTTASGTASVVLNTDGSVTYNETVTGLTPTAAHFHNAPTGTNGGVVKTVTLTNNTASGTWSSGDASQPLTDQLLRELVRGRLYLNAHTSANPGGEIRGQVEGSTGIATSVERVENGQAPTSFRLDQNYPNPFNPTTAITFHLPAGQAGLSANSFVTLKVFDMLGREVATLVNEQRNPGTYKVVWDAFSRATGVYFYRLAIDGAFVQTKRMTLLK